MPTLLITGANRGLGLEFVRQYAADGWRIHACCREPGQAAELNRLAAGSGGKVTVHALDVTNHAQIDALARALGQESIDLLLSNAGVYVDRKGLGALDYEGWARTFRINTMAPIKLAEAFTEQVARSERKLIVNVTSLMGSIGDNGSGGSYVYRSSKAALNAATRSLSIDLAPRGISACVIHPGWVKTDMGGSNAPLEAPESVRSMRSVIERAHQGGSGKFFDYDGEILPW